MTLTAHAPAPALVTSLSRAGWGELSGRKWQGVRSTLRALVDSLPHKSAHGWATEPQIAQRAGLSLRWVRHCLHLLEDLGVVVSWVRGGVVAGRPTASSLRLSKRRLLELIEAARPEREAADAARRARTANRVAGLLRVRRNRRSAHTALSADLPTPTGEAPPGPPPVVDKLPDLAPCEHGAPADRLPNGQPQCPICRRMEATA